MKNYLRISSVLVAALLGMGATGTAAALPEMQVGTMIVSSGDVPASVNTVDDTAAEPVDPEADEATS
jgi:hypothetical protein